MNSESESTARSGHEPAGSDDAMLAELLALEPAKLPAGLVERIGRALDEEPAAPDRRPRLPVRPWQWGRAGIGLAACLTVTVVAWRMHHRVTGWGDGIVEVFPKPVPPVIRPDAPAPITLAAYDRAIARSPEAVDELLSQASASTAIAPRVRAGDRLLGG